MGAVPSCLYLAEAYGYVSEVTENMEELAVATDASIVGVVVGTGIVRAMNHFEKMRQEAHDSKLTKDMEREWTSSIS